MTVQPARITGIEYLPMPSTPRGGTGSQVPSTTRFAMDFEPSTNAAPTTIRETGAEGVTTTTVPVSSDERILMQAVADAVRGSSLLSVATPLTNEVPNTQQIILKSQDGIFVISQDALWSKPESDLLPIEMALGKYLTGTSSSSN